MLTDPLLTTWRECWRAPAHLAVVHGPDAGWAVPLTSEITVGRQGASLALADPGLNFHHCTVRPHGQRWQIRDERSHGGTRVLSAPRTDRGRQRLTARIERQLSLATRQRRSQTAALRRATGPGKRIGHRWQRLEIGDQLILGATRLQVRPGPAQSPPGLLASVPDDSPRGQRRRAISILTLIPALAMVGMLVAGGHASAWMRWVLVGGIALSLMVSVGGALFRSRARPSQATAAYSTDGVDGPRDPAAFALCAAALGRLDDRWSAPPADAARAAVDGGTLLVTDAVASRSSAALLSVTEDGLALTGPGARGAAAWLRAQLEARGERGARVLACPSPEEVPPGPWALVSADERTGVSPRWRATVERALAGSSRPSVLTELLGDPTPRSVAEEWRAPAGTEAGLRVPLGRDPWGQVVDLDLIAHGPHALVAGTTGSGKSELLASWVIALALAHPPSRLHLLLVDYKGGSTFAAAALLPHTVGVLTDLDGAASDRALATLRAELQRREALVAAGGGRDISDLADPPARLVVVVDELRALVEDSPDRLADLVRLATQGRSLGIHLILATQRPSGVVNAQLRANVNLRLCLRVLDPSDSTEVIGVADAATLPQDPGGAVVETGAGPQRFQVAWLPGSGAQELVAVAKGAAQRLRRSRHSRLLEVHRPWLPELPARAERTELALLAPEADGDTLDALLLVDRPDRQRRETWRWREGVLLVSGGPRSGRTTALQSAVTALRASGRHVHVISRTGWGEDAGTGATIVGTDDPRRLRRLLTLVAQGNDPRSAVVIDDLEGVLDALDLMGGPGSGQELITTLIRSGTPPLIALATGAPHRWSALATHHLALRVREVGVAGMLGVPRALVQAAAPPGRGVLLGGEAPHLVQVLVGPSSTRITPPPGALVLAPLPVSVSLRTLIAQAQPTAGDQAIVLGIGGDAAAVIQAPLETGRPWLVCGNPGSGRSTVLGVLAAQWQLSPVAMVTPESAITPEMLAGVPDGAVVLIDDADLLDPEIADALVGLLPRCRVVVAASTAAAQSTYRGIIAAVTQARTVLALGPSLPQHLAHARSALDPRGTPGRGVLVTARDVTAVQIASP